MRPFEIEIFYHNEQTALLNSLDLDFHLEEYDLRRCMLFAIDAVIPYVENDMEYTQIFIGNGVLTCPLTYDQFMHLYHKHNP